MNDFNTSQTYIHMMKTFEKALTNFGGFKGEKNMKLYF